MNTTAQLTPREFQVAELLAWGAAKKEIPDLLPTKPGRKQISVRTVEVMTKSIYEKLQIQKVSELAVWYFCTRFHISLDLSPLKRTIIAGALLALIALAEAFSSSDFIRPIKRTSSTSICRIAQRSGKRTDNLYEL